MFYGPCVFAAPFCSVFVNLRIRSIIQLVITCLTIKGSLFGTDNFLEYLAFYYKPKENNKNRV